MSKFNNISKIISFLLLVFLIVSTVNAADYSIDNATGSDSDVSSLSHGVGAVGGSDSDVSSLSHGVGAVGGSDSDVSSLSHGVSAVDDDNVDNTNDENGLRDNKFNLRANGKNFKDLEDLINANTNGTIDLDFDYSFGGESDIKKINITNKSIIINGNNHIIDAGDNPFIFSVDSSNLVLNNIKFINGKFNQAMADSLIYTINSNVSIINSNFDSNKVRNIKVDDGCNLLINNSNFTNIGYIDNFTANGLVVSSKGSDVLVNNSNFINTSGQSYAGAFISFHDKSFNIYNSNFVNCSSIGDGGALNIISNGSISNTSFINCSSGTTGGAIFTNNAALNITDCEFINNTLVSSNYLLGKGGACGFKNSFVNITNTIFQNNSANIGGSIYFESSSNNLNILDSTFNNNSAIYGGSVASYYNNMTYINNSKFINESSTFGGALSYGIGELIINNSDFINCNASKFGGAIVNSANLTIENSKFINNDAELGKDIARLNTTLNVFNSTISDIHLFDDKIHTVTGGYKNISMNDSSISFCAESVVRQPSIGNEYYVYDTSILYNRLTKMPVNEYIKILIYTYYYKSNVTLNSSTINEFQYAIWNFTESNFLESNNPFVKETIKLYDSGFRVPDYGATDLLENGSVRIYDFHVLFSPLSQNLINFKVIYTDPIYGLKVYKETLNKTVINGQKVNFNIVVKNTGTVMLNDINITESKYDGLVFDSWKSKLGVWKFNSGDNPVWNLRNLGVNQTAIIEVTFNSTYAGNFTNVIIAGSNEVPNKTTNNTTSVLNPNMTIIKISNNPTVKVGELISFTILLTNTGECNLTGIYVIDNKYSKGLVYLRYVDDSGKWSFNGKDKWTYNGSLAVGESANFTIVFNTTSPGIKVNTAIAGSNETNNTNGTNETNVTNNTNKTNVTNSTNKTDNSTNKTPNGTNKTHKVPKDITKETTIKSVSTVVNAGNPLFVLFLSLVFLSIVPLRRKR
ncbi:DUF11 domain-containing protein [Methanobrevibacter olleyae]|uniref:Adhesin-like protein n=1 Tax=Methanobrevibacter olleyae TaxID=294671 RepID=A0A126QZC1_METOL|nr:DUF11 domain-containing protein [Methanobrevibacter olleyae]AMK15480.1 adhesin-like protein [Methanobrevibacter olleyae]